MLKTKFRLKKRKEFAYVYKKGNKINSNDISMYFVKSKFKFPRFGLTVSNKVGNAVTRNKIKRRLRAILHNYIDKITYKNIIIVAHPGIVNLTFEEISNQIEKIFIKGKILNEQIC